ncbi:chorismate synthase [Cercophora newfieldiana]|uniref:chorismate synthase n=1 Tax=Cercophora newfieldiana TaxID=92897 RepID=A0AA39XRX9_9PEZI|nr:chorismate synthase [Cercophora newfieldiana]
MLDVCGRTRDTSNHVATRDRNSDDIPVPMLHSGIRLWRFGMSEAAGSPYFASNLNVPNELGEPCFDKLEAKLAHAMMSIPATKGFDLGSGFSGVQAPGSTHNDPFVGTKNE